MTVPMAKPKVKNDTTENTKQFGNVGVTIYGNGKDFHFQIPEASYDTQNQNYNFSLTRAKAFSPDKDSVDLAVVVEKGLQNYMGNLEQKYSDMGLFARKFITAFIKKNILSDEMVEGFKEGVRHFLAQHYAPKEYWEAKLAKAKGALSEDALAEDADYIFTVEVAEDSDYISTVEVVESSSKEQKPSGKGYINSLKAALTPARFSHRA